MSSPQNQWLHHFHSGGGFGHLPITDVRFLHFSGASGVAGALDGGGGVGVSRLHGCGVGGDGDVGQLSRLDGSGFNHFSLLCICGSLFLFHLHRNCCPDGGVAGFSYVDRRSCLLQLDRAAT